MNSLINQIVEKEFNHLSSTYLNSAYLGPSPLRARERVNQALEKELDPSFHDYYEWSLISDRLRESLAKLLSRKSHNITHSTSVSDVTNVIANGFSFHSNDIVCSLNGEYPSNVIPWMLRAEKPNGPKFQLLDLNRDEVPSYDWLKKNIPNNTKVLNLSWVAFDTGKKIDIAEVGKFTKERDILLVIDGTQGLGSIHLSQEELSLIDIFTCATYKWLLGPYGHAFGYFSDKALDKINYTHGNWIKSPNSKEVHNLLNYTTTTLPGALKYDRGQTPNMLTMSCLEASLEIFHELDSLEIQNKNSELRNYFLDNYPKKKFELITPKENIANIVSLKGIQVDPLDLEKKLKAGNIDISVRQGNLRVSFHFFNNKTQVDKLLKAIDI